MSNLSLKYRFLKVLIKLIGFKKYFSKNETQIMSKTRKSMDKTKIPVLSHSEINDDGTVFVYRIDRGGDITYHGFGQIQYCQDSVVRWHRWALRQ